MYTLIIEDRHGRLAAEISFDQGSYTIGRVDGNDVVLPSNSVSRTHARIFVSNNKCYIDDLGSANGVTVDGVALKTRTEIGNGSKIRIGEYTLYLEYKDNSANSHGQDVLKTQIVSGGQGGFKIVRVSDKFAGEEFMLSELINSIGRTEDNYILLSDPSISRNHAKIINQGMTFKLSDLDSSNGTFVNGKRIRGEVLLQSGDEVRFGNVRFVFVSSNQRVDLALYAKRGMGDNRMVLLTLAAVIVVVLIIFVVVAIYVVKDKGSDDAQIKDTTQAAEDPHAVLNVQLDEANRHFREGRFPVAQDMTGRLLETWPHESRVKELHDKVEEEIRNEQIITEGDALFDARRLSEALDKYREVNETAMAYARAKDRIEDTERRIQLMQYNEAFAECDARPSQECIEALCKITLALKHAGKQEGRVQDTIKLLEGFIGRNKKGKFAVPARKCLLLLQSDE
ncbi:MAG: FHA domain-containing protein [Proteobacteria bacterium]|nr:FHA domain-containing protein [Pseudomonadota bacterium]